MGIRASNSLTHQTKNKNSHLPLFPTDIASKLNTSPVDPAHSCHASAGQLLQNYILKDKSSNSSNVIWTNEVSHIRSPNSAVNVIYIDNFISSLLNHDRPTRTVKLDVSHLTPTFGYCTSNVCGC